jgi:hypothetical protein
MSVVCSTISTMHVHKDLSTGIKLWLSKQYIKSLSLGFVLKFAKLYG